MPKDLDQKFGALRLPAKIEPWEVDVVPVSKVRFDERVASALNNMSSAVQNDLMRSAARSQNIIWAMDRDGDIILAVEELAMQEGMPMRGFPRRRGYNHPAEDKKLGHPTLLDGKEARIAGELAFDDFDGQLKWVLNANSGRYCRTNPPQPVHLENVADFFRRLEVDVVVDPD